MTENENVGLKDDVKAKESWLVSLSRDFGKAARWGKDGIDLLLDATGSALNTTQETTKKMVGRLKRDPGLGSSEEALFQKLGAKIAACPGGDYLSLREDAEFWQLVRQINALRKRVGRKAVAGGAVEQDAPEGAVAEEPEAAKPPTEDEANEQA